MRNFSTIVQVATIAWVLGLSPPLASVASAGAFASSTDLNTGVTTTSVANPDGTRTVTTTAPVAGVGAPAAPAAAAPTGDFATTTNLLSGATTTSVANADGTHTVSSGAPKVKAPKVKKAPKVQAAEDADTLLDTWMDSNSGLSFAEWEQQQESELGDLINPYAEFEQWGDDDWDDRSEEQIEQDRLRSLVEAMEQNDALEEEWESADSGQSFEDWRDEQLGTGDEEFDASDFEEWGDEDWDDGESSPGDTLNPAPQQNAVQNAIALAVQSAQSAATANAVRQVAQHASRAGAYAAAEAARPRASAPRFSLMVRVR